MKGRALSPGWLFCLVVPVVVLGFTALPGCQSVPSAPAGAEESEAGAQAPLAESSEQQGEAAVTEDAPDEPAIVDDTPDEPPAAEQASPPAEEEETDSVGEADTEEGDGDLNGDGLVDDADLDVFLAALNTAADEPGFDPALDLDADGVVSQRDYQIWYGRVFDGEP
jgi:hypothetical protein